MAIRCPNCGNENPDDYAFCDECGARLPTSAGPGSSVVSSAVAPTPDMVAPVEAAPGVPSGPGGAVICPHCGAQNVAGAAFCDECGTPLPGGVAAAVPATEDTVVASTSTAPAVPPPAYGAPVPEATASRPRPCWS